MTYVALLRAVNVGGQSNVSMSAVREAVEAIGLTGVRTYINSGNLVFSTRATDAERLAGRIEKALEERTGLAIKVLVLDHRALRSIVDAVPAGWVDDRTMRTYVLLLWRDVDDPTILDRLPSRAGIDELRYTPGAVAWRVDRENVARSRLTRLVGTPLYKRITIRSVNTLRKLVELTAASG